MIISFLQRIHRSVRPIGPTLQEFHFKNALKEIGVSDGNVRIDHRNGVCWHKHTGRVPLVFPEAFIRKALTMAKEKNREYFFRGVISEGRDWIRAYDGIEASSRGRDPQLKYEFDSEYFRALNETRFALSPTGDCPWSYRFFESIMCKAIPILGRDEVDIFSEHFQVQRDGTQHLYNIDAAEHNLKILLERHTLRGILAASNRTPTISPRGHSMIALIQGCE